MNTNANANANANANTNTNTNKNTNTIQIQYKYKTIILRKMITMKMKKILRNKHFYLRITWVTLRKGRRNQS